MTYKHICCVQNYRQKPNFEMQLLNMFIKTYWKHSQYGRHVECQHKKPSLEITILYISAQLIITFIVFIFLIRCLVVLSVECQKLVKHVVQCFLKPNMIHLSSTSALACLHSDRSGLWEPGVRDHVYGLWTRAGSVCTQSQLQQPGPSSGVSTHGEESSSPTCVYMCTVSM